MENNQEKAEIVEENSQIQKTSSFEKLKISENDEKTKNKNEVNQNLDKNDNIENNTNELVNKEDCEKKEEVNTNKFSKENELFEKVSGNPEKKIIETTKEEEFKEIKENKNAFEESLEKIQNLVYDCLYDEARDLMKKLKSSENFDLNALPLKYQNLIVDVEETCKHIDEVCFYLNDQSGWNVDSSNADVTTYYKKYPNGDSYLMKMEGELNFPIKNMCSIVYEIEYFNEFIPFCKQSYTIKQLSKGSKLCYFFLDIPFWSNREGFIRGFGVDRIDIDGTILIISKTIDEDKGLCRRVDLEIPTIEKATRLKMDHFCFEITPITKNKFKLRSLLNIEPKVSYVPQFIMNFFARKIGSHMFSKLIACAEGMDEKKWEQTNKKVESKEYYLWINKRIEQVENQKKYQEKEVEEKKEKEK